MADEIAKALTDQTKTLAGAINKLVAQGEESSN